MLLYYFASLERYDHHDITNNFSQHCPLFRFKSSLSFILRRDNRSLSIFGVWLITFEVSIVIGNFLLTLMAIRSQVGSTYLVFAYSTHPFYI